MSTKTQFKTNIVKRYKNGESSYQISADEGCSYNAVLRELKRRGINTGLYYWSRKEIEKLKKLYPIASNEELLKGFPNRTKDTIRNTANNLGLKKRECKKICKKCGEVFIIKKRRECNYKQELCSRCLKRQWEQNNRNNAIERQKRWLQKNPEYLKQYVRRPEVRKRIYRYLKQLRKENPKFHLDSNMGVAIYQALKEKKGGRHWESLVDYTIKNLMEHLENLFDDKMNWGNYGSFWQIDHVKPRSLFRYTSSDDLEFKKCWALENLQPLEKIANLRKGNKFICNISCAQTS